MKGGTRSCGLGEISGPPARATFGQYLTNFFAGYSLAPVACRHGLVVAAIQLALLLFGPSFCARQRVEGGVEEIVGGGEAARSEMLLDTLFGLGG